MKRFFVILFTVLFSVAFVFGGLTLASYLIISEKDVPQVVVAVDDNAIQPVSYVWSQPVVTGVTQREFEMQDVAATPYHIGILDAPVRMPLKFPAGYETWVQVLRDEKPVWNGLGEEWNRQTLEEEGYYRLEITCTQPFRGVHKAHGEFAFLIEFYVQGEVFPAPELHLGSASVAQGDVLAVQVKNPPPGEVPAIVFMQADILHSTPFMQNGEDALVAFIPTSFSTPPGSYTFSVVFSDSADDIEWSRNITVRETSFPRQDMEIDLSDPVISEANSQKAYDQYNNTIPPLWPLYDEEKYWQGAFIWPCGSELSTQYGHQRFTNGAAVSRPHSGIDIRSPEGTPVLAPANGRVLFADYLLNTGNTVVIEHGGGLKTCYYHMYELDVVEGQIVQQGSEIGLVGSTGYSTGPHLHFEARIANISINPMLLFEGGGLYAFEPEEHTGAEDTTA